MNISGLPKPRADEIGISKASRGHDLVEGFDVDKNCNMGLDLITAAERKAKKEELFRQLGTVRAVTTS